jgi:imidazole glycerol phosphate synthase glutamine amidotransferase subunit
MKVGLIDYGRGNLHSVAKALEAVAREVERVTGGREVESCDLLVLPGVGAFGDAVAALDARDLRVPLLEWLRAGRPFLGICLGYQLLFSESEESPGARGLGWLPGRVVKFPPSVGKVPHMGWNEVRFRPESEWASASGYYYHVHSYYPVEVPQEVVACTTDYGGAFVSGIRRGAVAAFQFHPEKSQAAGRGLLRRVVEAARPAAV